MDILFTFIPMFLLWLVELMRRREAERSVKFWQDLQEKSQAQTDKAIKGWNESIATINRLNTEVSDGGPLTHDKPAAQSHRSLH